MNYDPSGPVAIIVALVVLVICWLLVGWLMPKMMGWIKLEELFPDQPNERVVGRHHFQALYIAKPGAKSLGPSYRGCVTFTACETGLRISIWKLFMPFSSPIFIPWEQIEAVTGKVLAIKVCSLKVGKGERYTLSIIARVARRIAFQTGGKLVVPEDLK